MSINLGICKDESNDSVFNLRCVCNGGDTRMIITKNDIELFSTSCKIDKNISNFESCKKTIHSNSYDFMSLNGSPLLYFFKPEFNSLTAFGERLLKVVFNEDVLKVNQNITNTPNETITLGGTINFIKTKSYNPIFIIPTKFQNETTLISVKNSIDESVVFHFNQTSRELSLSSLNGNETYTIEINYLEKSNGTIVNSLTQTYDIYVEKKKLASYELKQVDVLSVNNIIPKVDIDNDLKIVVKNVNQNISFSSVMVNIPNVLGTIKSTYLTESNGIYDLNVEYDVIGLLESNELYTINITGLKNALTNELYPDRTSQFATNVFHSCVKRTYVSDIFMNITNVPFNNDTVYFMNETEYDLSVEALIGYYNENIETELNTIC